MYVVGYFEGRLSHRRELVLPTGGSQLLVNLDADRLHAGDAVVSGAALKGPDSAPSVVDTADQRAVLWVAFSPGCAAQYFDLPLSETADRLVPLGDLWGVDVRDRLLAARTPAARIAVMDAALRARTTRGADPAIASAVSALHRGVTVSEVADRLGWTGKRLRREFLREVGLAPKLFARVSRFQRLIASVPVGSTVDWARLAAEVGYYDQAHLVHDFHDFARMTPTAYAPRSDGERNHVPFSPSHAGDPAPR